MSSKTITKNNVTFTVISNDEVLTDDSIYDENLSLDYLSVESFDSEGNMWNDCSYEVGEKIIEFIVGCHKDRVIFGGFEDDGRAIIITSKGPIYGTPGMDINRQTVAEVYAEHYKVDIYKITNPNKTSLFEAATDMSEKKALYDMLGIKVETAYKYDRKIEKKCP